MTRDEIIGLVIVAIVVAVAVLYLAVVAWRKRQLLGRPGGLSLALRAEGDAWTLGVGRYADNELWWYAAFRLGRRPTRVLRRSRLEVTGQRGRRPDEPMLPIGTVVVECVEDGDRVSLSLSSAAVTGFLSWLEASAPRG